jgi:hypothetical protein
MGCELLSETPTEIGKQQRNGTEDISKGKETLKLETTWKSL